MQHILGQVRRCVEDYHMIEAGDKVAVGVSGGKDSLLTLMALARLRDFYPLPFQVEAITLETGTPGMSFDAVAELCRELEEKGIPYQSRVLELDMGQPFRSLEDAAVFFRTHSRDDPAELTPEALQSRLQRRDDPEFPWYFPVNEPIGLLWFQACEIPDKEKER